MAEQSDDKGERTKPVKAEDRRARLERELRANLSKRKAQARARKGAQLPPKEGGQTKG